jgi:GGDEF domain-containing protein
MDEKYSSKKIADLNEPTSPLEKFAKKVFDKLIEDGVPPLPSYYKVYFFNLLEDEPVDFKKQIYEIISLEDSHEVDKDFELEKKLKLSFRYTKELLQHTAIVYKNTTQLREILANQLKEISHITSPKILEKLIQQLENKIDLVYKKLEKENKLIKQLYAKNVEIIKDIESNSLFDPKYGVYNKAYFLKLIDKEAKLISKFSHISSIVVLKLKDSIVSSLSDKGKVLANRSLAKMLLKTSRRTDEIAHLGDGVFGMLLKHTDRIGAGRTVERIADMIGNAAIFLEGEELELSIVGGITEIKEKKEAEKYLQEALNAMKKAEEEKILYTVYEGE